MGWLITLFRKNALLSAARDGKADEVSRLLNAGVDVDVRGDNDMTPLHEAAKFGHPAIIQSLVQAGADTSAVSRHGRTPLDIAVLSHEEAIKAAHFGGGWLTNHGALESVATALRDNVARYAQVVEILSKAASRDNAPEQVTASISESYVNGLGMKFVPVPGTRVHFCIWETRVMDFEAFVKATGYDATRGCRTLAADGWGARGGSWKSPGFAQTPEHPVCCVNWEDAKAFCKWLTNKEREEGRLRVGQEYRLPTDAEWSVAVGLPPERGGTPEFKDGKIENAYPWGTQWPPPAGAGNYCGEEVKTAADTPSSWEGLKGYRDGYPRTSPVGSFAPNRFGLYDMGGNAWEFCEDSYNGHSNDRALRGASWVISMRTSLLSSARYSAVPGVRSAGNGFRCVSASEGRST